MVTRSARRFRVPLIATGAAVALAASVLVTGSAGAAPAASARHRQSAAWMGKHERLGLKSAHRMPQLLQNLRAGLPAGVPTSGRYAFLLRLSAPSTIDAYRRAAVRGRSLARTSARTEFRRIKTAQAHVIDALPAKTTVLYKTHSVLAGIGVVADVHNYGALRAIRGVQAVYPIAPKKASNSYAMQLQGAPAAWQAHGDLGANSKIAIIDTGVDYTHADFGGTGTSHAYDVAKAADTVAPAPGSYDATKFDMRHSFDLAGDAYDPSSPDPAHYRPHRDPNPLDCDGHGTHVAGTAAGYGVTTSGAPYAGPYDTTTNFANLAIGPGMAPHAKLFVYKVFGCTGDTDLIAAAIDWATDPNRDGVPSDHVDVINMSLGADFTSPYDGDAVAADLASRRGVTVVAASGNSGDMYDVGGSPSDDPRVIAVANSVDAEDYFDSLNVTAPAPAQYRAERSVDYNWIHKPDLAGNVVALTGNNDDACDNVTTNLSGKIALIAWTDDDTARRCGSAVAAGHAAAAGAKGFILTDDQNAFAASISGSATIPGVLVTKNAGDAIRASLRSGTVTVGGTTVAAFKPITTANNDKVNSSSSRGIRGNGNVKPDVSAVGTSVFSAAVGTGSQGVSFTGTSMATPMVAGLAALIRSIHPTWTPEQVKADIMNTAGTDLYTGSNHTGTTYAPNRVGAGRINAANALANQVLAYVRNNAGAVSVSFGPVAVAKPLTLTKTVNVVNTGGAAVTYDLAYRPITTVPGVAYQLSTTRLTVPAHTLRTFTVRLVVADPKRLTKTWDATKDRGTAYVPSFDGTIHGYPGDALAEASGRILLTHAGSVTLRVPVYSAPRPASAMATAATEVLPGSGVQTGHLGLRGSGVNNGTGAHRVRSLVAGFELQARSGRAARCSVTRRTLCWHFPDELSADLAYVGTTSDYPLLKRLGDPTAFDDTNAYFAISTRYPWRTPVGPQEFDIVIDTNGDNIGDAIVYNTRASSGEIFTSELMDTTSSNPNRWFWRDDQLLNERLGNVDTAVYDNETMVLPVWLAALGRLDAFTPALPGFNSKHSRIRYGVISYGEGGVVDSIGVSLAGSGYRPRLNAQHLTTDLAHPGVEVTSKSVQGLFGALLNNDLPGTSLTVRRDVHQYNRDHGKGLLLFHFQNLRGNEAKVVALKSKPKISLKLSETQISPGQSITATVTVANTAGHVPTGTVYLHRGSGSVLAHGRLKNGRITFTWRPGQTGTVYATYSGNAYYYAKGVTRKVGFRVG